MMLVMCPTCGGEGGHYEQQFQFSRWHLDPPSDEFIPCEDCQGQGMVEGEPTELDLEELRERCGDYA